MPSMTEITCKCGCGRKKMVRTADVKRGWGKYYSKSCKAKAQEKRTGQCAKYYHGKNNYKGSGVSKETFKHYQQQHGGIPEFDRNGDYVGFQDGGFSNEEHDCNKDWP